MRQPKLNDLMPANIVTTCLMAICLALPATTVRASVASLRAAAEEYAGQAVRIDERLAIPDCPAGYRFERASSGGERLHAICPGSSWHMWIPLAVTAAPDLALRRGQALLVRVGGQGFEASARAIVQSVNRREGTVVLRNAQSGQRFIGDIQPDGSIRVSGRKLN